MLKTLTIQNYALIDAIDIDFFDGFSVITGETGAGKSILLGALSLILGNRADTNVLKNKEQKCVVEAYFNIKNYRLNRFFKVNELEYDDLTIVRRTISPSGKSRAFINDEPVNLNILKELGDFLIDIHSQHHNLLLNSSVFQLKVVDSFARLKSNLDDYKIHYKKYNSLQKNLNELKENYTKQQNDYDYNQHRFQMLVSANLEDTNLEKLEELRDKLSNSEEIKLALSQSHYLLAGEEKINILAQTKEAMQHLSRISQYFKLADELNDRIKSARIDIQDIAEILKSELELVNYEPEELVALNQKIDNIYTVLQNFRVKTISELIEIKTDLNAKLNLVDNFEAEITDMQKALKSSEILLQKKAELISKKRKEASPKIQSYVNNLLTQLGMPYANFVIEIDRNTEFSANGIDELKFLFTANKNTDYQELGKIASGGEMSRLMLSIKSLLSKHSALPTIVFDEIDTGVSGDIASKMGQIMHEMSTTMQVLSITHLPQVAARGQRHYMVYKQNTLDYTNSDIQLLTAEKRVEELAKMLSGEELSQAAIENAKALLGAHTEPLSYKRK